MLQIKGTSERRGACQCQKTRSKCRQDEWEQKGKGKERKKERKKETKDKVRKRRKPIKRTNKCKGIIEENRRNIC